MLEAIKNAVTNIIDFIEMIYNFIKTLVTDTATLIKTVGHTVASIPDYFSMFPAELLALIVALFGIVVVYKFLGREG